MIMSHSHIQVIINRIGGDHKHGLCLTPDIQSLTLANGIKMSPVMFP